MIPAGGMIRKSCVITGNGHKTQEGQGDEGPAQADNQKDDFFFFFLKRSHSPSLLVNMWISDRYNFGRGTVFYRSACCTTNSWPLSVQKGEFIFQLPTSLGNSEGKEDKISLDLLFKCFIRRSSLKPSSIMSHQPSCCASFTPC